MRWTRWLIVAGAGAVLLMATVLFVRAGLAQADQRASVLSLFVGTLSLTLGLVQAVRDVRRPEKPLVITGEGNQIVNGNVRIKVIHKAPLLSMILRRS